LVEYTRRGIMKFKSFKCIFLISVLTIGISVITSISSFSATLTTDTYTVKNGDCLSVIAQNHGEALNDLRKANNIWNNSIFLGQVLNISIKNNLIIQQTIQNKSTTTEPNQVALAKIKNAASNSITSRNGATFSSNSILAYASNFLGIPYVWGGTSPSGFDCSGFTQYVFAHFGINLPRVSEDQQNVGTFVSRANLQPGDLVFFGTPAHHVGIYVGGGNMINAPHTGAVIRVQTLDDDFTYGRRVNLKKIGSSTVSHILWC
jgi:cell wall-associated NlpC family hydrolase